MKSSPCSKISPKKSATKEVETTAKKQLNFNKTLLQDITNMPTTKSSTATFSIYNKNLTDSLLSSPLSKKQTESLRNAIDTSDPTAVAHMIRTDCKSVYVAIKKILSDDLAISCEQLCKRKNTSSVLYNNTCAGITKFKFSKLWEEMVQHHCFLTDIFNAISGNLIDFTETKESLKIKHSFVYSVLMNSRWHELSLLQRINTDGGCSKQLQCRLNPWSVSINKMQRYPVKII
ncbi:uncharacterized protein LOC130631809 [Hydractinia symbiolongicarpus]|uniref:uncharacterized protein LOC130631809 n=1 Tax=Hydractinia symbiolongicarpus TaxID=13093 RepID=UPI00255183B9|nr:uncharacterized protein LOC130631809 [Hydractinia symbiolongicarpus]